MAMKPNLNFEFDPRDIEIIETALRRKVSEKMYQIIDDRKAAEKLRREAKETADLLARIHHQKNWYRPKNKLYVSG